MKTERLNWIPWLAFFIGSLLWMGTRVFLVVAGVAILIAVLFVAWMSLSDTGRMNYSEEGDAALKRLVAELRSELLAGNKDILEIESLWAYGYPKVALLFSSDGALEQAEAGGQIERIANRVAAVVKAEPDFGRNRESFDPQQALLTGTVTQRRDWDTWVHGPSAASNDPST